MLKSSVVIGEGSKLSGKVSSFDDERGFGFIKSPKLAEDIFVHRSALKSSVYYPTLTEGLPVEFTLALSEKVVVTKGKGGEKKKSFKAVDVTGEGGALLTKTSDKVECFICREKGHGDRNCPQDMECHNCNKFGHRAKDCQEPRRTNGRRGSGGDGTCNYCRNPGHFARNCPEKDSQGSGGGGGARKEIECYNCNELGHFARDCQSGCSTCGDVGHKTRDHHRQSNGDGGGGGRSGRDQNCYTCNKPGHFARDCKSGC